MELVIINSMLMSVCAQIMPKMLLKLILLYLLPTVTSFGKAVRCTHDVPSRIVGICFSF